MDSGIGNSPLKRRKIDGSNNSSDGIAHHDHVVDTCTKNVVVGTPSTLDEYNSMLMRNQSWEYSANVEPFSHWIAQGITEDEAAYRLKTSKWLKETAITMRRGEFPDKDNEVEDWIKWAGISLVQKYDNFAEYSNDEILPHWEEFIAALKQFNPAVVSNSLSEEHTTYFAFGNFRLSQDIMALIKEALSGKSYSLLHFEHNEEVEYEYGGLNVDAILDLAESNVHLQELEIHCNRMQFSNMRRINNVVRNHPSLLGLDLWRCFRRPGMGNRMLEILLHNDLELETLAMGCNGITTDGIIELARFLGSNPSLIELDLEDNQLGEYSEAVLISNALEKNTTLKRLLLKDNNCDSLSIECLRHALYDDRSLNAMSDSNHYCDFPELDDFITCLNDYEDVKANRGRKIYAVLSHRNHDEDKSNLQDFIDIDTKMLPKVLEVVQHYDTEYPDVDEAECVLPRVGSLSIVYEIMRKWDKVFNDVY